MLTTDTVVIGAGHAGLAVSRLLTDAGRDHVVIDRGRVAERWRTERWDSLHLLTPNWMTRLPGWHYPGPDSEAYMAVADLVAHLERYAASFAAPVRTGTTVLAVTPCAGGYRVTTDQGTWATRHVVVATGPWGRPRVPAGIDLEGSGLVLTTASRYRNPGALPDGGVLVVGASSSGVQIADELSRAGRRVVLAAGRHTRMPRRYRGLDVFWWLERTGRLARTIDEVRDPAAARNEPSLQLVGRNEPDRSAEDLDLAALAGRGVRVTGRLRAVSGGVASVRGQPPGGGRRVRRADAPVPRRGGRARGRRRARPRGLGAAAPRPFAVHRVPTRLDLRAEGIGTVLLATGYRPDHPWLRVPVTGPDGVDPAAPGVTPAPGLYVVGQRFQHRRDSGFIDGARHDAESVVTHLASGRPLDPTPR